MNDEKDEKYEKVACEVNQTIRENLKKLLSERGFSQREFCRLLASEKTSVTRTYFNKILHEEKPDKNIPAAFLLSCCDFFGITLQNLVSTTFDAKEYAYNDKAEHKDYLNIEALLQKSVNRIAEDNSVILKDDTEKISSTSPKINGTESSSKKSSMLPLIAGDNLITDSSHILFKGYIQDYYCYYYPTDSSENSLSSNILKGILQLKSVDNFCKANLKINTNTIDDTGNINYKEYSGYAAISPTVNSMNCILYSDFLCEFCFLMFRHFKLNFGKQDCRIAEVLSSSSATEDRRPTVLRMLLSREKISDEDLEIIAPAFSLNYSTILVNQEIISEFSEFSEDYQKIVNDLSHSITPQVMFFCKEDDVYKTGLKYLKSKEKTLEFVMRLRATSYSYKYNKIGSKADANVRKILLSKGYYKKKIPISNQH